jgi:dipeptidyl aminopeptidase/acylaminoacyl peptidase
VYDGWKSIGNSTLSPRGGVISYEVNPQEGDGRLVLRLTRNGRETIIERGYRAMVTPDEQYAVCLIKPFFQDTRQARIKKKKDDDLPKDSLAVVKLSDGSMVKYANVNSYRMGEKGTDAVAFASSDTALISKGDRKKKKIGRPLLVYHFRTAAVDTLQYVDGYAFDKQGKRLTYLTKDAKKKAGVGLYEVDTRTATTLSDSCRFYTLPQFDEAGTQVLFLASNDTLATGSKHCELFRFRKGEATAQKLIDRGYTRNLPQGWGLTENSQPRFSDDGTRIFAGVALLRAPKDTTIVDFETAGLDLWHYAEPQLQPQQLKSLQRTLKATCQAVYNPDTRELLPLTTSAYDRIGLIAKGNAPYALSADRTRYMVQTQWDMQAPTDLSLVDLHTGKRTVIGTGRYTSINTSPGGKYVLWYDYPARQWYIYSIENGTTRCLTDRIDTDFWDTTDDTPDCPSPCGIAAWTADDREVLLYDNRDIWKIATDGSTALNLTGGEGKKSNRTFYYLRTDSEQEFLAPGETLLLSVFDNTTKKRGYATVQLAKGGTPQLHVLDGFTFSGLRKAKDADVYLYQKANFNTSPNVYLTRNRWKSETCLSDINPQMKDYSWGTAELYQWTAYDGTKLDGLLYKPEGFDPSKKYPVILYFYERRSDNLYAYYAPAPSRSTINISFFCSRGYVVFVPDIVYHPGTPGEDAYNCVVSGVESLTRYPWVDKDNMAIQGQSWGGYQVAYLITRTPLFKAAGAGAPVVNMTSAYGGIRWETGMSRQFQYEQTQSRIGRTLWQAPEVYLANSPLFKLDRVQTPVLIMHNDADGAVPWYQGIEMFTGLRRLGKPAWLLQYNGEAHNLVQRRNSKDLSIRLQQFFDYYLKGAPMPAWMKTGIPATRKGEYFGLEEVGE